ncbi:4340_t:CDS:2 [Rhizophagus irregularis]|nr:4340_t:CDS:2 [Rhizophagus irregularis]
MSTNSKEQTNNSDYIDWIEKAIEDNYITYFDYDEFTNKQEFENSDTTCWENDPDERPSIQKVVSYLTSYQDINEETNSIKFEKKNEIKKGASNKDFDYIMIDDDLIIDEDILNSIIQNDLQNDLLINITDSDDIEKIINKLIDHLIKMHDEFGYGFAEVKQIIEQNIKNINQTLLNNIPNWLKNQTSSPKYNFFHGFLYFNGIIVKNNGDRAFGLFSKSSKENYPMAQVYLDRLSVYFFYCPKHKYSTQSTPN